MVVVGSFELKRQTSHEASNKVEESVSIQSVHLRSSQVRMLCPYLVGKAAAECSRSHSVQSASPVTHYKLTHAESPATYQNRKHCVSKLQVKLSMPGFYRFCEELFKHGL